MGARRVPKHAAVTLLQLFQGGSLFSHFRAGPPGLAMVRAGAQPSLGWSAAAPSTVLLDALPSSLAAPGLPAAAGAADHALRGTDRTAREAGRDLLRDGPGYVSYKPGRGKQLYDRWLSDARAGEGVCPALGQGFAGGAQNTRADQ